MADLVRVVGSAGRVCRVSREWLSRWPDDFRLVSEVEAVRVPVKVSRGRKKKGK